MARKPIDTSNLFQLEWAVDESGYEAASAEDLPEGTPRPVHADPPRSGWYLRRKGGALRTYRPLEQDPGLFRRFAYLSREPREILAFANAFGILGVGLSESPEDPDWLEHVNWWHTHIQGIHRAVKAIDNGEQAAMASIFNGYVQPGMTLKIETSHGARPRGHVVPTNLVSAMWLQVFGELTDGISFRKCVWCPTWFPYGPGTGHRDTKQFCSDRCRKALTRNRERGAAA